MSNSLLVIIFFLFIGQSPALSASENNKPISETSHQPVYMQVSYFSVPPDQVPVLLMLARDFLHPTQIERVKNGAILDWNLYEALITGPQYEYNFVSITKTTMYAELFGEWTNADNNSNLTGFLSLGMMDFNLSLMSPKFSEIWVMQGAAMNTNIDRNSVPGSCIFPDCLTITPPPSEPSSDFQGFDAVSVKAHGLSGVLPTGNYITKNFMDTRGSSGEHFTLELDFWRPIHHVRIERNILNSWAMYTLSKPGGASRKYNYSTIDYYDRMADVDGFDSRELAEIAHPDLSAQEISDWMNRTGPSRTAWKTELWRKVMGTFSN